MVQKLLQTKLMYCRKRIRNVPNVFTFKKLYELFEILSNL